MLLRRRLHHPTVTHGELASALKMSPYTVRAVEMDQLGLDAETYARWEAAIDEIARSRREKTKDDANDGN